MIDAVFNSLWGWLGIGGVVIAASLAVAYFFPPFRKLAFTIAAATAAVLAIYTKGAADAKKAERKKRDAAVKKVQDQYGKIDDRPDTDDDVARRLRDRSF